MSKDLATGNDTDQKPPLKNLSFIKRFRNLCRGSLQDHHSGVLTDKGYIRTMTAPILVVDDSQTLRLSLVKMISDLGFTTIEAGSGLEGLEALQANPEIQLVLSDYNMPDMNGIEMINQIKSVDQIKHVKCVIVTSIGKEGNALLQAAKEAGVIAWITKPVQKKQLQNLISKLGI